MEVWVRNWSLSDRRNNWKGGRYLHHCLCFVEHSREPFYLKELIWFVGVRSSIAWSDVLQRCLSRFLFWESYVKSCCRTQPVRCWFMSFLRGYYWHQRNTLKLVNVTNVRSNITYLLEGHADNELTIPA